jgi:predicted Zn-dependent protease
VQYKHGLQAIRQDRITQVLGMVAEEALKDRKADNQQLAELFDGSIGDITTTLIANGYSQNQEFRADQGALYILAALGYDPGALTRVLQTMKQRLKPNTADFYRTHPSPDSRIREISKVYQAHGSIPVNSARQKRFLDATEGVD